MKTKEEKMKEIENTGLCPSCKGLGYIKDKNGTIHTCYDCMGGGRT